MTETHDTYVQWLEDENRAFADACARDLALPMPTCPGWTVLNLLEHHASFQLWIAAILNERLLDPRAPVAIVAPDGDDPIDWYRTIGSGLIDAFRATDPGTHVWGVTNQQTAGAWARRQASETSVHRWDADDATGFAEPVEHADDYISEIFDHLLPALIAGAIVPDGAILLISTDQQFSWTAAGTVDRASLNRRVEHADVTLSGTTSDLLLSLWNRPNAVEVSGDENVLHQWRRAITGS